MGLYAGLLVFVPADCQCKNKGITMETAENLEKMRNLNDNFRRDIFNPALGTLIFTPAVAALRDDDNVNILNHIIRHSKK